MNKSSLVLRSLRWNCSFEIGLAGYEDDDFDYKCLHEMDLMEQSVGKVKIRKVTGNFFEYLGSKRTMGIRLATHMYPHVERTFDIEWHLDWAITKPSIVKFLKYAGIMTNKVNLHGQQVYIIVNDEYYGMFDYYQEPIGICTQYGFGFGLCHLSDKPINKTSMIVSCPRGTFTVPLEDKNSGDKCGYQYSSSLKVHCRVLKEYESIVKKTIDSLSAN